jgi:hypothetical protein
VLRARPRAVKKAVDVTVENENYHGITAQEIIDKIIAANNQRKKHNQTST